MRIPDLVLEKLRELPPDKQQAVLEFVESLRQKWRAGEAIEGLQGIAGEIQRPDYRRGHRGSAAGDVGQISRDVT